MTMNIDDLTLGQLREIRCLLPISVQPTEDHPYPTGENVFIRTVTMYYTGKLVRVTSGELVLTGAAWIADMGRFHIALAKGTLNEVEPFPDGEVIVPRGGVIDVSRWLHELPRACK
jgi:hypothetical protein